MSNNQVAVLAKITALPGQRAELIEALQGALTNAAGEAGTLTYILHEDAADTDSVWFYELYADQAAFDAHVSSPAFAEIGKAVRPFGAGRPEMIFLKPVGGKGL
jgi:quinol monooxygenase YgiN